MYEIIDIVIEQQRGIDLVNESIIEHEMNEISQTRAASLRNQRVEDQSGNI